MATHRGKAGAVLGFALGIGCGPELPSNLGDVPLDRVVLTDSPVLAHLAQAIPDDAARTVEDLFRERPDFDIPPDPSAWLEAVRAEHAALPVPQDAVGLRVLTYNAGLLDRWYPFAVVRVPHIDERRGRSAAILLQGDWDILLLQEVWDLRDVETFKDEAAKRGYTLYAGSTEKHEEHGLVILVRTALIDPAATEDRSERTFGFQRDAETFPGPGIARGYLAWRFRHAPTGATIHVFNTHLTAFPSLSFVRETQVRELGLATQGASSAEDIVLVGGDLNAAPYYPWDTFGEVDGDPVEGWWRNAMAYPLMMHYGGLQDVMAALEGPRDVRWMQQLAPFEGSFAKQPLGDRTRCAQFAEAFTATDCNTLYFEQYAGTEYPARIDHILWRDPLARVRVQAAGVVYAEPLAGESFELSDHYGLGATLAIGR